MLSQSISDTYSMKTGNKTLQFDLCVIIWIRTIKTFKHFKSKLRGMNKMEQKVRKFC